MKYGAMGSVRFMIQPETFFFSFRASLPGGAQLTGRLSEHCETASAAGPDQNTKQSRTIRASREPMEWKEEYRTPMHDHLKAIKAGLIVVSLLALAGTILPFLFMTEFSLTCAAMTMTLSLFLPVIYYLIFSSVLVSGR